MRRVSRLSDCNFFAYPLYRSNVHLFLTNRSETTVRHMYILQSFGINPLSVPVGDNGEPAKETFLDLIEKRQTLETQRDIEKQQPCTKKTLPQQVISSPPPPTTTSSTSSSIMATPTATPTATTTTTSRGSHRLALVVVCVLPTPKDVLFGRGREYQSHGGNIVLEGLIQQHLPRYMEASTVFQKTCIVMGISQGVKRQGGRFLRTDKVTDEWSLVEETQVHGMIAARIRKAKKVVRRIGT